MKRNVTWRVVVVVDYEDGEQRFLGTTKTKDIQEKGVTGLMGGFMRP